MIHQFKFNNYNIVVDANSASVHSVDDAAYDIIAMMDDYIMQGHPADAVLNNEAAQCEVILAMRGLHNMSEDDVLEVIEDLISLNEEGLLWSDDPYEAAAEDPDQRSQGT